MIISLDPQFSIDLRLIGGVIILQTLPALVPSARAVNFARARGLI